MKSKATIKKPDNQLDPGYNILPVIISILLFLIFIGAQVYLFIETLIEW